MVGNCQGRVQGYLFFTCWGCEGARDGAHEHKRCAYGVLRVDSQLLHPTFDQSAIPETSRFAYGMNERWQNIVSEHHLRLSLAYPPRYAPPMTTWYDYIPIIPVFTTEKRALLATPSTAHGRDGVPDDKTVRLLEQESRLDRRIARQTLDLAKNIAEGCQLLYRWRTHRRLLASRGTSSSGM